MIMINKTSRDSVYDVATAETSGPEPLVTIQTHMTDKETDDIRRRTRENSACKLDVKDLNFYYGKHHALKSITLQIREKRVTAFIGPSGCGKSTLLRTFNRIYDLYPGQYATGEVLLDNENILSNKYDLNSLRSKIGMVFQKPTPFPMSIYDNIAFGVKLYEKLT